MNIERIKDNITIMSNGCWEWQKSCNSAGYGQLTENKTYWLAHRYTYACFKILAPDDVIRHLCHNPKCCNPEHLLCGSHSDNWYDSETAHRLAASQRRKTWVVGGVSYDTINEASKKTGLSLSSLVKYTINGFFDSEAYIKGCNKANVIPNPNI